MALCVTVLLPLAEGDGADELYSGLVALKKRQYAVAIVKLREAAKEDPKSPEAWRFLGECAEALGQYAEAHRAYGKLSQLRGGNDAKLKMHVGCLKRMLGIAQALERGLASALGNKSGACVVPLGSRLLQVATEPAKGLQRTREEEFRPSYIRQHALDLLSHVEFEQGRLNEALCLYDLMRKSRQTSFSPCLSAFRHGLSAFACKDWRKASSQLNSALKTCQRPPAPVNASPHAQQPKWRSRLAGARLETVSVREALAATYILWAQGQVKGRRWRPAEGLLRRAEAVLPGSAAGDLAQCSARLSKASFAVALLERALNASYSSRADVEARWKPMGAVGEAVLSALAKYPPDRQTVSAQLAALMRSAAVAKLGTHEIAAADELLRDALAFDCEVARVAPQKRGEAADALLRSATDLLHTQNAGEAYAKLVELVSTCKSSPQAASAQYHLGECLRQLRQWSRAAKAYRRFLKEHPKHQLAEDAHINLIYLLAGRLGKPKDGISECERLMQRLPNGRYAAEACYLRGMYYATQLKDNESALTCFEDTLADYPKSFWAKKWAPKRIKQLEAEMQGGEE